MLAVISYRLPKTIYMSQKILLVPILVLILFSACRKDKTVKPTTETEDDLIIVLDICTNYVTPINYFPAHPGSWWNYNQVGLADQLYEIDSVAKQFDGECMPYFNQLGCFVRANNFTHTAYYGQGFSGIENSTIIPTNVGDTTICFISMADLVVEDIFGPNIPKFRRILIQDDTTVTNLNGNTFTNLKVVKEIYTYDSTHLFLEYFAPNIGLIKRDSIDYQNTSNITEVFTLESYFINE